MYHINVAQMLHSCGFQNIPIIHLSRARTVRQYALCEQWQFYTSSDPDGKFIELRPLRSSISRPTVPRNAAPLSASLILRVAAHREICGKIQPYNINLTEVDSGVAELQKRMRLFETGFHRPLTNVLRFFLPSRETEIYQDSRLNVFVGLCFGDVG